SFGSRTRLISVDLATGKRLWDRELPPVQSSAAEATHLAVALFTGTGTLTSEVAQELWCLDWASGRRLWQALADALMYPPGIAISDGTVVWREPDAWVAADAGSGAVRWRLPLDRDLQPARTREGDILLAFRGGDALA